MLKKIYFVLSAFFFPLLMFEYIYSSLFDQTLLHFLALNYLCIVFFIFQFIVIIRKSGLVSIHSIINFFYFILIYGRPLFLDLNNVRDFLYTEVMGYDYLGINLVNQSLIIVSLFIFILNFIYISFGKREGLLIKRNAPQNLIRIVIVLFLIFSLPYTYKLYVEYLAISSSGYISMYNGALGEIELPFIVKYSHYLFYSLYSLFVILHPNKRSFLFISGIFLLLSVVDSLKGHRIGLVMPIFLVFYYSARMYNFKLNLSGLKYIVIFVVLILLYSNYIFNNRNSLEDNSIGVSILKNELINTGSTLHFTARFIKKIDLVDADYPFFLEPLFYPYFYMRYFDVYTKGQSEDLLFYRNSLNHRLSAVTSYEGYLAGRGLGSSAPAEFFQYGFIVFLILTSIYGFILNWVCSISGKTIFLFLGINILPQFFFLARDTPFPNLVVVIKSVFIYYILKWVISYFFKYKISV